MTQHSDSEPVLLGLVAFVGIAGTVAVIANELLGPNSPLRTGLSVTGRSAGYPHLWATILIVGIPAAVVGGLLVLLYTSGR